MNRIPTRLLLTHSKRLCETSLIPRKLAVQPPRAPSPPQHAGALAAHPRLIVRLHTRAEAPQPARRGLEDDEVVGERDGDEAWALLVGEAGVEEVAELPGVGGCEGFEDEGIALLG